MGIHSGFSEAVQIAVKRFAIFINEACNQDLHAEVDSPDLWNYWCKWCDDRGEWRGSKRYMGLAMANMGYRKKKLRGHTVYFGLCLRDREHEVARPTA